ncbi:MAG: FAD-binding protein [Pseudomonadota bacterium]|nr:FAD-binding protein [Pseudomonadota bacterium]
MTPADEAEAAEIVRAAEAPFDIVGGSTRPGLGRPRAGQPLSSAKLTGIVFHEPAEMTLRARAGAALAEVEAALAKAGQMLPFEPLDPRALFATTGEPTVGGLVATAIPGPRRVSAGAVRDNVLGLRLINGRGEIISAGGRVMKNVTGLDLVKIVCGAQGTLGFVTEATFKLLPAPPAEATVVIRRLDDARAVEAMAKALSSPHGVSGAATIHPEMGREFPRTLLRVEGFAESVAYRAERLIALLADFGAKHALEGEDSKRIWRAIRDGEFLAEPRERAVWRASLKPSDAPAALAALGATARASLMDHGGGCLWFSTDPTTAAASAARTALGRFAGHLHLIRAPEELRAGVDVFPPLSPALLRLTRGVKASLDPSGRFNPGRMYADI